MSKTLVFVHGWAYGPSLWDDVIKHLPNYESQSVDLGFFGAPFLPDIKQPVTLIGHSFGLLWALREAPFAMDRLISVNAFPRFTAAKDFPHGQNPRVVTRMARRLAQDPAKVVTDFRASLGDQTPTPKTLNDERLAWGLDGLAQWDERAALTSFDPENVLALAGEKDETAPPPLTQAAWSAHMLAWNKEAGHLLPKEAPEWTAKQIAAFVS